MENVSFSIAFLVEVAGKRGTKQLITVFAGAPKKRRSLMSASVNAYRLRYIASFGAYAPPNSKLYFRAVGELATSSTRSDWERSFDYSCLLFSAFKSENSAFGYSRSHCFHTVQIGRWSKVWSSGNFRQSQSTKVKPHIPRVEFYILSLV